MKWYNKPLLTLKLGALIFFAVVGIVTFATVNYMNTNKKERLIEKCPRYTIGYATIVDGREVNYSYSIMGKTFTGAWGEEPQQDYRRDSLAVKNLGHGRFLLRVHCQHPEVISIDWSQRVPSSIVSAPSEGWTVLPSEFTKIDLID